MQKIIRLIHRLEDSLLVVLLLTTVLLAATDILARLLFSGGGVVWIGPTLRVLVLWLGLLGALLATRTREQIAIDVLGRLAPPRLGQLINCLTTLFAAIVCILIAWHSQRFIQLAYDFGDIAFARVPAWPLQLIIPISFALMALRFIFQSGTSLLAAVKKSEPSL